jgi:hypothetical protein
LHKFLLAPISTARRFVLPVMDLCCTPWCLCARGRLSPAVSRSAPSTFFFRSGFLVAAGFRLIGHCLSSTLPDIGLRALPPRPCHFRFCSLSWPSSAFFAADHVLLPICFAADQNLVLVCSRRTSESLVLASSWLCSISTPAPVDFVRLFCFSRFGKGVYR